VVLLRKSIPQNHNLKRAAELGVSISSNRWWCMKKYFVFVLSILLISCGTNPTKKQQDQKMAIASIITHPVKGTAYFELEGKSESLPAWDADKDQCYREVLAKGVVIDGKVEKNFSLADAFIDSERKREIQDSVSGNERQTEVEKTRRMAYQKVHNDLWVCLKNIGWSSEIKLVPVGK
jgi:hypothetical protein